MQTFLSPLPGKVLTIPQFLVGAVTSSMLSCSSMKAWFTAGACSTPRDVKVASISLWYAFAVDLLTDLMSRSPHVPYWLSDLTVNSHVSPDRIDLEPANADSTETGRGCLILPWMGLYCSRHHSREAARQYRTRQHPQNDMVGVVGYCRNINRFVVTGHSVCMSN